MAIPLILFFFSFPVYSVQTAFVAPIHKDHISDLYSISLSLKTPLIPAKLHLDLGGAFSWLDCYHRFNSSTSRDVNCESPLCESFDSKICGNCYDPAHPDCFNCFLYPEKPALRDYIDYQNPPKKFTGSQKAITDVLALHSTDGSNLGPIRLIPDLPFSCVNTDYLRGLATDVIGLAALGSASEAIPSMVSAAFNAPRVFAVCLSGSRSKPGVAFFGSKGPYKFLPNVDLSKSLTYIRLLNNSQGGSVYTYWRPSFEYYIDLAAIEINGNAVVFNTSLLTIEQIHGAGGAKVSTSTTYASLQTSILKAFTEVLVRESAVLNLRVIDPVEPFSVCYATESVNMTAAGPAVPDVDLVIGKEKTVWRMKGRNSMVRMKKKGVDAWCLGFVDGGGNPRTPIVIGGLQMEDRLLQFDLENHRMGFSSSVLLQGSACSDFNFTSIDKLM